MNETAPRLRQDPHSPSVKATTEPRTCARTDRHYNMSVPARYYVESRFPSGDERSARDEPGGGTKEHGLFLGQYLCPRCLDHAGLRPEE